MSVRAFWAIVAGVVAAGAIFAGGAPAYGSEQRGENISRILSVPTAIPGTRAYNLEQTGREISAFVTDLDAVEDTRVALRQRDDGQVGGLITLRLSSKSEWDRALAETVVEIVSTCAPAITLQGLKIIDQRGKVLYSSASPRIAQEETPGPAGSGSTAQLPLVLIVAGGVVAGILVVGIWWWMRGRAASPNVSEESDEVWAFLKEADPDAVSEVFEGLRPEMVGAVVAGLDEVTRSQLLDSLPAQNTPDSSPTDQMHPEVDRRLQQILRDRLTV